MPSSEVPSIQGKKIFLFRKRLSAEGGAERLMLELDKYASIFGAHPQVVVFSAKENIFNGKYQSEEMFIFHKGEYPSNTISKFLFSLRGLFWLKKIILKEKPQWILAQGPAEAEMLYFATLFSSFRYSTFIHGTKFWMWDDKTKYARIFRKSFQSIRNSVIGHQEFISPQKPTMSFFTSFINEIRSYVEYKAVRKSEKIFVVSNQMRWEVQKLYDKEATVVKGGIDSVIFGYKATEDIKKELDISEKKLILDVSRLDPQKRIALSLEALHTLKDYQDFFFVVAGSGDPADKEKLEALGLKYHLENRTRLLGYVSEETLLNLYASADLVLHPCWVEFDITILEALAFGKKVVCSSEVELTGGMLALKNILIFPADPNPYSMAQAIKEALGSSKEKTINKEQLKNVMSEYFWENYSKNIFRYLD